MGLEETKGRNKRPSGTGVVGKTFYFIYLVIANSKT